jgi:UDP-N-acetylglucosamine 3-dehydrogenase
MKVGVLGAGSIGMRHIVNLSKLGYGVFAYDPLHHVDTFRDEMLDQVDAVVICTPTTNHTRDIHDCVTRNKHFLCEKPFGYDDPDLVSGIIQSTGHLIIATGFNLRFHSCVMRAKALLHRIGKIEHAGFTVYQKTEKPVYLRDGILRNWCSHEIDLANYLLGPGGEVTGCTAPADENGNDTTEAVITMSFPSVAQDAFILADYFSEPERRFFFIDGELGGIYVDLVKRHVFCKDEHGKRWQEFAGDDSFDDNYLAEMQTFMESVERYSFYAPLASGEDGVVALRQVLAARKLAGLND